MGRPVVFADVCRQMTAFGPHAMVVTVTAEGAPHVTTAVVEAAGDRLSFRVGARTRANLEANPRFSLTWPPVGAGEYQLIVDGALDGLSGPDERGLTTVSMAVDRGILHRLAELPGTGASCVALDS